MKKFLSLLISIIIVISISGCSESSRVNHNISKQADYFEVERRITVYNARTDKIIFEAEGFMSISNNANGELVITCKTGADTYKKNYVYLNDYTFLQGFLKLFEQKIREEPTADVEEVRHSKLVQVGSELFYPQCSECGKYIKEERNYCPNCGAKMDKECEK